MQPVDGDVLVRRLAREARDDGHARGRADGREVEAAVAGDRDRIIEIKKRIRPAPERDGRRRGVRTVVRGERASRSIVNRTTALWSIWAVASLILAGCTYLPVFV